MQRSTWKLLIRQRSSKRILSSFPSAHWIESRDRQSFRKLMTRPFHVTISNIQKRFKPSHVQPKRPKSMWWSICICKEIVKRNRWMTRGHAQEVTSIFTIQLLRLIETELLLLCKSEATIYLHLFFEWNYFWFCRYRKFNLFLEDHKVRRTLTPDISIFETDFGVKFGLIICFDLVFKSPTQELLNHGVRNIAYPAMWYSALPFYSGEFPIICANQNWFIIQKCLLFNALNICSYSDSTERSVRQKY